MTTLPCGRVQELLPLFAGDDLDVADNEAVRVHLIGCMACRSSASGFQRATAGLRELMRRPAAGPPIDEDLFASLQESILARVEAVQAEPAGMQAKRDVVRPWGLAAAATALLGVGFWWGQGQAPVSVWDRPPVAAPAVLEAPKAVPYSGPRAPLRLLGNDTSLEAAAAGHDGAGMRGRDELRNLVDEGMVLPPQRPRPR